MVEISDGKKECIDIVGKIYKKSGKWKKSVEIEDKCCLYMDNQIFLYDAYRKLLMQPKE